MSLARVAIVTGASRGLGQHIARSLARDGWFAVVNYRSDASSAEAVVESIRAAGGAASAIAADATEEDDVRRLVESAREFGAVTAVIANATGPQPQARLEELTWQAHLDQLEFFVKSPTLLVQAALPSMRAAGGGRVILIGSDMHLRVLPGWSAYVAAKTAQLGLTKVWARELGTDNITVNLVAPGWIPVERHGDADTSAYVAEVPMGRMGRPEDVADMVAYLASDAAGFVTGQHISVNGGHVL